MFTLMQTYHKQEDSTGRVIDPAKIQNPTTHNAHKRETSLPGFEPAIPVSRGPLESAIFYSYFIFLNRFSNTPQNIYLFIYFVGIRPAGAELFQTDGRTDIRKLIFAFRDLEDAPKNVNEI